MKPSHPAFYPLAVMAAMVSLPALAEDSPHSFTANVGLTSDYLFRGISQTGHDPAIQGGFDYAHGERLLPRHLGLQRGLD
jgi:uncharacterized protein (TIGR02001 family)